MSEEKISENSQLKQKYLAEYFIKYTDLIKYINTLPMNIHFKQNAVTRLDESMFWTRDGILSLQTIQDEKLDSPIEEPAPLS
jgi:hypothetical protein